MYYYGSSGGYGTMPYYQNPYYNNGFVGYTQGQGFNAALWIVLFILLVIIIGAGWTGNGKGFGKNR